MKQPINLALAFDENYLTPFYVLLTSIFENNRNNRFRIFTIATGIDEQEKKKLSDFASLHQSEIIFLEIDLNDFKGIVLPKTSCYTIACYYRLLFPSTVPKDIEKLLYLDTDIVVTGDLLPLYQINAEGYPMCAVAEVTATRNRPDLGIYEDYVYFNAGVMIINVPEWRKQKVTERAIEFERMNPGKLKYADQDSLNVILYNNYKRLPARYNTIHTDVPRDLTLKKQAEFLKDKVIIHYTLMRNKPWNFLGASKLRNLYYYYLHLSPKKQEGRYLDTRLGLRNKKIYSHKDGRVVIEFPKNNPTYSIITS